MMTAPISSLLLDKIIDWLPGLSMLRRYESRWLVSDVSAGLVLTAILIPVGMSYAEASGLPAIYGLYTTISTLLIYALFGPSRILVLGPDSALAGLIATTILPLSNGSTDKAIALASMLALMTGVLCIIAGLLRLGFITELLSKPIRYGYLNGIALTVLVSQLPKLFGLETEGGNLIQELIAFIDQLVSGEGHWLVAAIGCSCLVIIKLGQRFYPRLPAILIAMLLATLFVNLLSPQTQSEIAVVGRLPQGFPAFVWPILSMPEIQTLFAAAIAITLVAFADMSVLSRTYAQRLGDQPKPNQELIALGLANLGSGLFHGFSVSSSASRTPVAESAGAKTQLTNVIGAIGIGLVLYFSPALLQHVPRAVLAAIVIAACLSLVEIDGLKRLYRIRPSEFWLSIICFLGVALIDVVQGIFLAVGVALIAFVWRAWRPYDAVLGVVMNQGYRDIRRHPEAEQITGLLIFRWDAPLFFANQSTFDEHIQQAIEAAKTPTNWIIIAAEPITDIDVTAADMLLALNTRLNNRHIELNFAEMKGPVKDRLKDYGLFTLIGAEHFFPTIESAIAHYLARPQR
ncbi:SulP family inorganic anion transporter [Aquirhabdus parva]|nr:SulP family inorganic anion transporter [Aquirhabdus parva]